MTKAYNKASERDKRRMLRRNMPQPESVLWAKLRDKRLNGLRFKRQYSVGKFVLDFYCPTLKLAIEIDGASHFVEGAEIRDKERQTIIETYGITFLRFTNMEVQGNVTGVTEKIVEFAEKRQVCP